MNMQSRRATLAVRTARAFVLAAVVAGSAVAVTTALAPTAGAATSPTYEPDPDSLGTVSFYDNNGVQVTSGSLTSVPFVPWLKASSNAPSGSLKAINAFYTPVKGALPATWQTGEQQSSGQAFPQAGAPGSLSSATTPVVHDDGGLSFQDHIDDFTSSDTDDPNVYQVRIAVTPSAKYWSTDILIDPTNETWTQLYPNSTVPAAPTAVTVKAAHASATVTWTAPAANGGDVPTGYALQYSANGGTTWTSTAHAGTTTSQLVTGLTNGTSYVFRVAAVNAAGTGAFSAVSAAVKPFADAAALAVSRSASIAYGKAVAVTATLTDTTTKTKVSGATVNLLSRTSTAKPFVKVGTARTNSAGVASLSVAPHAKTLYEWSFAGTTAVAAATSAVSTVSVAQVVTAAAKPTKAVHAKAFAIYGTVAPAAAGLTVVLQVRSGSTYRTIGSASLKRQKLPNGTTTIGYVLSVKEKAKGTYTFRVIRAATSALSAGTSPSIVVKVV